MKHEDFIRASQEAKKTMKQLAELFPGCFHPDGKPIIASAHFPRAESIRDQDGEDETLTWAPRKVGRGEKV